MRLISLISFCVIAVCAILLARQYVVSNALDEISSVAQKDLQLRAADAIAYTNRYAVAAVSLAKNPFVIDAVNSRSATSLSQASRAIQFTQLLHSATDVKILMRENAEIIASANDLSLGVSMQDRPYVQAAFSGRLGRESLYIGQAKRSYAVAAPIFNSPNGVIGVIVISASLNDLLNSWALSSKPLIAETVAETNDNRIFLSNREDWLKFQFEADENSDKRSLALIDDRLGINQVVIHEQAGEPYRRFVKVTRSVPLLEWDLHQLVSYREVIKQANLVSIIVCMLFAVLAMVWQIMRMRSVRAAREFEQQQEFARTLEDRVARRTEELRQLNLSLESEVQERRTAEQDLRKAQRGLVQATKLASIGQMSAALAHEYNQPISAIRFYADNSKSLFDQGDRDTLQDNLDRIVSLTERMSGLTNSLRNFSYQPQKPIEPVRFHVALDEAIMLMKPKILAEDVDVIIDSAPDQTAEQTMVNCGQIRIVQVITNLISNAIDAMKESPEKRLTIQWQVLDQHVELRVKDIGVGIDQAHRDEVFDAFYTTKSMGKGLGLGLFVVKSIVESFDGTLTIEDEPDYGAVFVVQIPLAQK